MPHRRPNSAHSAFVSLWTGATKSEALKLTVSGLNITLGTVFIRKRQAYRSRSIPICKDLQVALKKYLHWRSKIATDKDHLFVKNDGHALVSSSLALTFRKLRELAASGVQEMRTTNLDFVI